MADKLNVDFLAVLVACGFLAIVFLLYFNRVFASLLSWGLRVWVWHQYRIYIDFRALQISLLGGRVFFTGLRYHGNNETIFVQNGYITWVYWLRRVKEVNIGKYTQANQSAEQPEDDRSSKLPCRVNISLLGLEWFIYNRSPAYDSILAGLTEDVTVRDATGAADVDDASESPANLRRRHSGRNEDAENPGGRPSTQTGSFGPTAKEGEPQQNGAPRRRRSSQRSSGSEDANARDTADDAPDLPLFLQLFPVHLECSKAALVMGNENTRSILTVKTESLSGEIGAAEAPTPDPYRQIFKINFKHPVIEMKENLDFKEDQANRAFREKQRFQQPASPQNRSFLRQQRRKILGQLRDLVPHWRKSVESFSTDSIRGNGPTAVHVPGSNQWQGLSRYLGDDTDDQRARWASVEYAAIPTVMDCPAATLTIFWDSPGKVTSSPISNIGPGEKPAAHSAHLSNINGDEPPAWAINLSIKGGSVNYGPWADRQRAELQRTFAPYLCKDAVPAQRLSVGSYRVATQFNLYVELTEEAVLRVPVREDSKNWRFKGQEPVPKQGPAESRKSRAQSKKSEKSAAASQRPYGWLDVKVAADATISYSMDMVAGSIGFNNNLKLDVPRTEISSSINHELLWRSGRLRLNCDLSNPLKWNGLRQWYFDVISDELELFLLRDHVFLLTDLVDDWASGPPAEYLVFTPFKYYLDLRFNDVKLCLNVNDANIIDNPTDLEDNTYISISSPSLQSTTCIAMDKYRPSKNTIPFEVRADTASVALHFPPWSTQASFLDNSEIGHAENLVLDGSYHYNATTSNTNIDTLILNLGAQSPVARLPGFVVRYFLKVKDNYFGEDVHFKTLEEYQTALRLKETDPAADQANKPPHKKSNEMDVMLNLRIDDPKVLLPANIYSCNKHIQIDTASLGVDLRFTSYYMDLDLSITPLNLSLRNGDQGLQTPMSSASSTQLFIDGLTVYGNRLFGLPPTEPTYLCNWDISVGAISGECSVDFTNTLANVTKAFIYAFEDDENALVSFSSILFWDVTFMRAMVDSVSIWVHVEEAAFLLSTGAISVNYNDWARSHYSKRSNITIPDIKLSCVNADSAARHKSRLHQPVDTDMLVQTSVHLATIGRKAHFTEERKRQQELVRREDQRTHRTPFLILPGLLDELVPTPVDPPTQSVPPVPQPTAVEDLDDQVSFGSNGTSRRSRGLRHKSSFLSLASSSNSSILRPHSARRSSVGTKPSDLLHPFSSFDQNHGNSTGRQSKHTREISASTRHSAFYSAVGEHMDRHDLYHNTVAFSSQYFAPYFPMEHVQTSTKEAPLPSIEKGDNGDVDDTSSVSFDLEDIDPDVMGEDRTYSSTLIELPEGVTAFLSPAALRHVVGLLSALQPSDPEDMLDALQTGSMGEISDMQKEQKVAGHVADLSVRLPRANVRFVNSSDLESSSPPEEEQDQYNISISKVAFSSRADSKWGNEFKSDSRQTQNSFHLRLSSAALSAAERFKNIDDPQAAVLARVERVMVSMGSRDLTYLDVDVGNIQGSTSSRKIEYLAALIHRTSSLASEIGNMFGERLSCEKKLMRFLAHRLITESHRAPDPIFLTRPSAVLRSVPHHLRTFDSWKLIMRLRQLWSILSPAAKEQLRFSCLGRNFVVPPNVRQEVVVAFEKWRSWDLENLSDSVLLSKIFGHLEKSTPVGSEPGRALKSENSLLSVVRIREMQLALDPGPKQNEVTFLDLTARLEMKTPSGHDQNLPGTESGVPLTVLNLYCSEAAVNLNWELCELADDILRLVEKMQKEPSSEPESWPSSTPKRNLVDERSKSRTVHCVMSLGKGSIAFDAINILASSQADETNISLLFKTSQNGSMDTNFILGCDTVTSRLQSQSQKLTKFMLHNPAIFVSHELQSDATTDSHTVKATASSKDLSLVVRQDPIALLEVLDLVVRDEVAQLYRLKDRLPVAKEPSAQSKTVFADRLSAFRVNVAMFMDQYTISVPLLRSLTYTVRGTVARAAMAANFGREIIFDFDVKENMHDMQVKVNNVDRSISLMRIPPTNGRVSSLMDQGKHSLGVFASVELIELDASAVYSLLSALNRPEVSNSINELQQQAKVIQEHAKDIFGSHHNTAGQPVKTTSDALRYAVHLTFAGLRVFGNSPIKSATAPTAHILFFLDSVHVEMANRRRDKGPILEYPEFHVNLRHVAFELLKGNIETMSTCGKVAFGALVTATSTTGEDGKEKRFFNIRSNSFEVNLSPDTISSVVDVLGYMGDKIKDLDTSRELEYLRKLRQSKPRIAINDEEAEEESDIIDTFFSSITYTFVVCNIQFVWMVTGVDEEPMPGKDDLVFALEKIELGTRTRNSARLTFENLLVQMVSPLQENRLARSPNSAVLPEVVFNVAYVSTANTRRMAFQAVGKSLDLRLTPGFIIPAANLSDSIGLSVQNARDASQQWNPVIPATSAAPPSMTSPTVTDEPRRTLLGQKRLESLLVDADFAGAVVYVTGKKAPDDLVSSTTRGSRSTGPSKGGQGQDVPDEASSSTVLRSPGLAWKIEFRDNGREDPSLHGEVKIDASSNILYPSVVPLIVDISNSVKEVVSSRGDKDKGQSPTNQTNDAPEDKPKLSEEESNILTADPSAVLGRTRLNLGLRICRQEFALSCQPIARVAATASFDDVYFTVNTVRSVEQGNFFAISGAFTKLQASVQHVYSRESTGSFAVDSIVLSLMNSKHVSGVSGVSAILKFSPMKVSINAKQLQDFMLFREIWVPQEVTQAAPAPAAKLNTEASTQSHLAQRYQQVAATAAFPWTATISITALEISLDLGQAIGKANFAITEFWVSSKKTSDWEQNLCLGFQQIGIESAGRMSGFVALQDFKLRTSIQWPEREQALNETPLIQASVGFSQFRVKAAFDYQAFLVADITSMEFLMYNVRRSHQGLGDRLVAVFDGDAVQVFGTTTSAAQGIAVFQAFQRLVQERKTAFEISLREVERFMKRRSVGASAAVIQRLTQVKAAEEEKILGKSPISLDTDVVVTLKALNLGVFPSTFSDHQVLKMEALNAQARFAASVEDDGRIHSILGLTLGQLRIGLAGVRSTGAPKALSELSVEDVVQCATGSRGGTIVKVPQVEAIMQTWQRPPPSNKIDYIFKTAFEGKIDVGWNWSRISFIRGMWANHQRALELIWGRELPSVTAIRVTGVPEPSSTGPEGAEVVLKEETVSGEDEKGEKKEKTNEDKETEANQQQKITAEVKVPQSKYEYTALEPPIIETPQLRDMGEATPPLEWIGLQRDRLPNVTHQIVIVTLLEIVKEVEDAYGRILGSS